MKTPGRILSKKIDEIRDSKVFSVRSDQLPTWCPGCGYFGIHFAINEALKKLDLPLHKVVVVSGIGCAGRYHSFRALTASIRPMAGLCPWPLASNTPIRT